MWELYGLDESAKIFTYILLSFAFFVGIMLIVSQEAFVTFNRALSREIGLKKRLIPKLEDKQYQFIDFLILKYPMIAGLLISVSSFMLLLMYK